MDDYINQSISSKVKTIPHLDKNASYRLRVGSDLEWIIVATTSAKEWQARFSSVLRLENQGPLEYNPDIITCTQEDDIPALRQILQASYPDPLEWMSYVYYGIRVHELIGTNRLLFEIVSEESVEANIYNMWAAMHPIYRAVLREGGLPLHAGLAVNNQKASAFAAPGGGGKSTTCSRLPDDWTVIGDDEMVALPEATGKWIAHPFPTWSRFLQGDTGISWDVNTRYPLEAIYFIEKSATDNIVQLRPSTSAALINQSSRQIMRRGWDLYPPSDSDWIKQLIISNASSAANSLKSAKLQLTLSGDLRGLLDN
ncbi:SynChlorMet cassette protein ScmC [Calditrichota bacterium]